MSKDNKQTFTGRKGGSVVVQLDSKPKPANKPQADKPQPETAQEK